MRFYLVSKSPRRRELLTTWGYDFGVLTGQSADTVNESPFPCEIPQHYVCRVTEEKAKWGQNQIKNSDLIPLPVLAADTTVVLDGKIFGKPANEEEAKAFLRAFSGRTHEVLTAVAIATPDRSLRALSRSFVTFRELSDEEIQAYVAGGEPMDKAGGYGIQGKAGAFVSEIRGSYSGIMGLPQYETVNLLSAIGIPYF